MDKIYKHKYMALCQGITDKRMIENAELLVKKAVDISTASRTSLDEVITAMSRMISYSQSQSQSTERATDRISPK